MELTRRAFLGALTVTPFLGEIAQVITEVSPAAKSITVKAMRVPLQMKPGGSFIYGIPYHQTDASTGQWLGIERK